MNPNFGVPRPMPAMTRLSLSNPALIFVHLREPSSHEELLNSMLQQALTSVLGSELGVASLLDDLFMHATMHTPQPGPPKTSQRFLGELKEQWWSAIETSDSVSNTDCPICLSDFKSADSVIQLPCRHTFHTPCGMPWLKEHNVCPTCRYQLPTDADDVQAAKEELAANESATTLPGAVEEATEDAVMEAEANALVDERRDGNIDHLADEILDEIMDAEATIAVQEQRQRRLSNIDQILEDVIMSDTVE
ncbi:hypothetical protein ACHHYP_11846 [Achlya hypogyna]|uniref:RING-type domain-containing protein n=1 Tax=Achlya hypogyna TaxID=1202772 RepID=A0A1V9YI96_ACHHY|nr:hypothetical protein ACHHYP_11846 [Achlya hypogyna]